MGLLSKANFLEANKKLAFSEFLKKYKINFFAVFDLINERYQIINSLGFDAKSLISSVSSKDFWVGLLREYNNPVSFDSEKTSNPLLQFFSFKIMDDVKSISACRFSDNKILLLCNTEITASIINDFSNIDYSITSFIYKDINELIDQNNTLFKITCNFDEAIETYILSKQKYTKNELIPLKNCIFNEISNRFLYMYNYQCMTKTLENFMIRTVFICNSKTSEDLLINHIILNLKSVLNNASEIIDINIDGQIENFMELKDFLMVD